MFPSKGHTDTMPWSVINANIFAGMQSTSLYYCYTQNIGVLFIKFHIFITWSKWTVILLQIKETQCLRFYLPVHYMYLRTERMSNPPACESLRVCFQLIVSEF